MTLSCPNCNQTILPTDTVCWHCGYQLPQQPAKPAVEPARTADDPPEAFSLSAVFVYGTVTTVVIIGLLLSMRSLGRQPLILLNPDTTVNLDWISVTDHSFHFTLDVPPTWQSFDKQDPQQQANFESLAASNDQFVAAVSPLAAAVTDLELLLIAVAEQPEQLTSLPGFVIVAQSEAVGRLTLDEIVTLIQQAANSVEIRQINIFRSFVGDNRASLLLKMPATRDMLNCQQHVVKDEERGYLIVGCAPETRYQAYSESIEKILASFQTLR